MHTMLDWLRDVQCTSDKFICMQKPIHGVQTICWMIELSVYQLNCFWFDMCSVQLAVHSLVFDIMLVSDDWILMKLIELKIESSGKNALHSFFVGRWDIILMLFDVGDMFCIRNWYINFDAAYDARHIVVRCTLYVVCSNLQFQSNELAFDSLHIVSNRYPWYNVKCFIEQKRFVSSK